MTTGPSAVSQYIVPAKQTAAGDAESARLRRDVRRRTVKAVKHLNAAELEAGLEHILQSPEDNGIVKMIVRRPEVGQREVLGHGELDIAKGLIGDSWWSRGSSGTPDRSANPEMQINIMNARVIALVATSEERWPLAGDQLYVDLDLSEENLPPGTRLEFGTAILEVTDIPHLGCKKFVGRFGLEAMKFVNSGRGKQLNLRGINAKVVRSGVVRSADRVKKVS